MEAIQRVENFENWRDLAREQLLSGTPPSSLVWQNASDDQQFLFAGEERAAARPVGSLTLPRSFVALARVVARHRDASRWALLYRVAWRIRNGEPHLLRVEVDDDVLPLNSMRKAVEHDIYKMRAFVRFRRVEHAEGGDRFVAWYRPDHHTLDANESFFVDRFGGMRWAILTPDKSLIWDLTEVRYGPGVPRVDAPAEDAYEDLWRAYYTSIYNPARMNLDAMRAQLPVRRWVDLPETRTIPELVRVSRERVETMARAQPASASAFIPLNPDISALRDAIGRCRACELCERATQPVFGEGNPAARIVLVGEQPGDEEDRSGHPFVGPAGQLLDGALREAGVDRSSLYLPNAVKAFRFEERGKRRIHQSPRAIHIATCRPWLDAELELLHPQTIVCLGATAAQSVLGKSVRINDVRGETLRHHSGANLIVTWHPSAALRAADEPTSLQIRRALIEDLARAASY